MSDWKNLIGNAATDSVVALWAFDVAFGDAAERREYVQWALTDNNYIFASVDERNPNKTVGRSHSI